MDEPSKPKVWQVMGENFELETKFKVIDYLGAGAYGMVCAVQDSNDGNVVAIKKCKKIFQSRTLAKRTLREMRLLRQFSHENIIKLRSILQPSDLRYYTDLYLVFEIMDTDLAQIIRSPQPLKEQHTQYFIYQLLRALEYLHSKNIAHRDIKPRNILVNADCTLKVADFGLARMYNKDGPESVVAITDYVTTRWYRAPEVIVGWSRYGAAIDMWAVGCIVAELISRSPLFPGENTMKQLGLIIRIMGAPSEGFVMRSQKALFRQYMLTLMHKRATELAVLIPSASPDAIDLIRRLLDYEPSRRPSASLCLTHRFIIGMSNSLSPPVCSPLHIAPEEFDFELRKPNIDDLRSEINFEIACYNQDTVQLQAVAENVSILVPKPRPPPTAPASTRTTRAQPNIDYYDPHSYGGNNNSNNSSANYSNYSTGTNIEGNTTKMSAVGDVAGRGAVNNDNATPEEVHVVERVEMDIPGTTTTTADNKEILEIVQGEEQEREEGGEGEQGEEMDVCSDYVDAPAYPAQYTSIDTFSSLNNANNSSTRNNNTTSQPSYTCPTTTTNKNNNMYGPTRPTGPPTSHRYSPNPNVIPTTNTSVPVYPPNVHNKALALPAAPQHPVHSSTNNVRTAQVSTPLTAAAVSAHHPPAHNRRPTRQQQSTKVARPPTPLVQRWEPTTDQEKTTDHDAASNKAMDRRQAQMVYDTYGGDVHDVDMDTQQEESSLLYPSIRNTALRAGANIGTTNVHPTQHSNKSHPAPATKYANTTTTAATIHQPPAPTQALAHTFSDSEASDTSSEIHAILREGAEQRLGIPLYVSSTDSNVDEIAGMEEDTTVAETKGAVHVSGEKAEYKYEQYADAYGGSGVAGSTRDSSHHYSSSLPYPPTYTTATATAKSMTSPVNTSAGIVTSIAATADTTTAKPAAIDTHATRLSTNSSRGKGEGSGNTRTRSSSHAGTSTNVTVAAQQRERAERQKQEEAAVMSSYFTCFCEHDREQEQREKYGRNTATSPPRRAHRQASTTEEESKIPELQEHLLPHSDLEEGLSSQDADAESGNYPTRRNVHRGRSRSDPEGRKKMWDSCVIA